jgi:hypothetical protein
VKKYYAYFTLLFLGISQISCQDKKQSSETETSLVADSTSTNSSELENNSPVFKAVLKTNAGMVRGISVGDDFGTIKESAPLSESQPENGKSFTESFDDMGLNFADVLYVKNVDNKVGAISIDIFVEKQAAVDSLMNEFKGHFDSKYGVGKGISKMMVWKLPDGLNVLKLQNVSTAKDPGLKIIFAKSGNEMLQ